MSQARSQKIRQQILRDVVHHPSDIASHIADIFGISRQAVNKHIRGLVDQGMLDASGSTRSRSYSLGLVRRQKAIIPLDKNAAEHDIYLQSFDKVVHGLPKNVSDIIFYGFTEMVNNAIDHSEGSVCEISMFREKESVIIEIKDNGEGIFKRITRLKNLPDEKQALLELHKGKLTTDPENHSGQGIFFTSKMFDVFAITSHGLAFIHQSEIENDALLDDNSAFNGTKVMMEIANDSSRTDKEIFDQYSGGEEDDYSFNKTLIPVALARFGNENLVSRSQAKRLLTRIESFKYVLFDFKDVETIGQAFADEIFRVYAKRYPEISLSYTNTTKEVVNMINRAKADL